MVIFNGEKMVVDKLNKSLDRYQKDMVELQDSEKLIISLAKTIRDLVQQSVTNANNTESVDERIAALIAGLQSVLKEVTTRQETFLREKAILEIRIETLEDLLLQDIEELTNPDQV
tara:strand:+ start:1166 stop:1513 length:348 start_codon:yes stop_codon:yes gene_type:complete